MIIWICFLVININFILIGCVRDGDVVCMAGLYGVYEMLWEFMLVSPHWTRRKIILIQFFLKKFYPTDFNQARQNKSDMIFIDDNRYEKLMFLSHYGVKLLLVCIFLRFK
jgi:hypothetical protein